MGIDSESDITANLQIGPTTLGMVRIYVAGQGVDLPLDFDPDEADEIAEELRAAAERARNMAKGGGAPPRAQSNAGSAAQKPAAKDRKGGARPGRAGQNGRSRPRR